MENFNLENLLESYFSDKKESLQSFIELFYWHTLKWYYQQKYQEASWAITVINSSTDINFILTNRRATGNIKNFAKNSLEQFYENGKGFMLGEVSKNMTKAEIQNVMNDTYIKTLFGSIESIIDTDQVKNWLIQYQNPNKRDFVPI